MAIYEISNVGAKKVLTIQGSNIKGTSLYDNRSVSLKASSGTYEQFWIIPNTGNSEYVRAYLNRIFGLNINTGGSKKKCDIHTIEGNETDAQIGIEHISGGYRLKMMNHNLYLTADGTTDGATVSWAPASTSNLQLWSLNKKDVITYGKATTLYGPVGNSTSGALTESQMRVNAKYIYDYLIDIGFTKQAACAVLGNFRQESMFNPAIWQSTNNLNLGYGIAQWSPASYFLQWAVDVDFITALSAAVMNTKAKSSVQKLMDAELEFLIFSASRSGNYFVGYSYDTFKSSKDTVKNLAKVFCQYYELTDSDIAKRQEYAQDWYDYFS